MDLKRLRAFVAVAEHGTVSRAAQFLHVTQPALSRQIGALEQELDFKLFERDGRRLNLTPRAEQFLSDCRSLLNQASALNERARTLRKGEIKSLKLAASAMTIESTFPTFLRPFAKRFSDVKLELIEAHATALPEMLERGEADLAINVINAVNVDDHRFGMHLLPQFHIVAACASAWDLGNAETIDIRKLVDHPLLVLDKSYATRTLFDAACRVARVRPSIFLESLSTHTLLAMAEEGHGVAVIPSILRANSSNLQIRHVTHRNELLRISLAVIWDKRRTLPAYAHRFSEVLDEHLQAVYPAPLAEHNHTSSGPASRKLAMANRLAGQRSVAASGHHIRRRKRRHN